MADPKDLKRGPEGESDEPRAGLEAAPVQPDAPADAKTVSAEAAGEALPPDPKKDRAELTADAAKELSEIPDNKYGEAYKFTKDFLAKPENASMRGPLGDAILLALKVGAMGWHFVTTYTPGKYLKNLDEDEELRELAFNEAEKDKLLSGVLETNDENLTVPADAEKIEAKTAAIACGILGVGRVATPQELAAKIQHMVVTDEDENVIPFYNPVENTKQQLDKGLPKGTIVIVSKVDVDKSALGKLSGGAGMQLGNVDKSYQMAYVAVGDKAMVKGFNPRSGKVETFDLTDEKVSPVSLSKPWSLTAMFKPAFNSDPAYFSKYADELDERLAEQTPENRMKTKLAKAESSIAIIESNFSKYEKLDVGMLTRIESYGKEFEEQVKSIDALWTGVTEERRSVMVGDFLAFIQPLKGRVEKILQFYESEKGLKVMELRKTEHEKKVEAAKAELEKEIKAGDKTKIDQAEAAVENAERDLAMTDGFLKKVGDFIKSLTVVREIADKFSPEKMAK